MARSLIILDRDGVINHDSAAFIKSPDEWRLIDGAGEAIGALTAAGFTLAVASNQSGVGRKLLDVPALTAIHDKMRSEIRAHGGDIDRIVYCPHHPEEHCACRKPKPGLFEQLARHYGLPLDNVPVVGDSMRDLDAAASVGARPLLVLTGNGMQTAATLQADGREVEAFADLADVATTLIAERRSTG